MPDMRLQILRPTAVLVDAPVRQVTAHGRHGSFTLLPLHVDYVAALVPGLLVYETADGAERYAAVDGGLLVKYGQDVVISSQRAILGDERADLRDTIETEFRAVGERERVMRGVMARLEADFVRRFLELGDRGRA